MNNNWHSHRFFAMGCNMGVWLETESQARAEQAFAMVVDAFEQAEQRMSRFRVDSELSWLNAQTNCWAELSPPMWNVIIKALILAEETNGLFDPTLHDALLAAGYGRSFKELNGQGANTLLADLQRGDRQQIALDPEARAICLPEGVRLDLGGIGKGFTAQTVVDWLTEWGPCLIDAGGDLTAGDAPADMPGWPVGIGAPWDERQAERANLMRLWLANGSLATSGIDYRKWQQGDGVAHHIIDPRTGISAETDILTCSVISADACYAEAWATATIIAGVQDGYNALLERQFPGAIIDQTYTITLTPHMAARIQLEKELVTI